MVNNKQTRLLMHYLKNVHELSFNPNDKEFEYSLKSSIDDIFLITFRNVRDISMKKEYYESHKEHMCKLGQKYYQKQRQLINGNILLKEEYLKKLRENTARYRKKHPEINKLYYIKNRTKILAWFNKKGLEVKTHVFEKYSNGKIKCVCCDHKQIASLTIDHIEGRKKHGHGRQFSGVNLYKWLVINNFPKGFRVLCMNCNFVLGHFNRCPHNISKEHIFENRAKKWRSQLKYEVFSKYSKGSPKCNNCQETIFQFLTINHILGRKIQGHSRKMVGTTLYSWLKRNEYPSGYEVLCFNCNLAESVLKNYPK